VPSLASQPALAAVSAVTLDALGFDPVAPDTTKRTPVFIVASPRPLVGKTFLARLIADFQRLRDARIRAFDLNPSEGALVDFLPEVTQSVDIVSTMGQMALFDRLIVADGVPKVIDVGQNAFAPFFELMAKIGFVAAARRRALQTVILFAANSHPAAVRAYAELKLRFVRTTIVPVFNEAIAPGRRIREQFPSARGGAVHLQIPYLAPEPKIFAESPPCSFVNFHAGLPARVPPAEARALRAWTQRTFLELRELELRLLMDDLRASLTRP